MIERVKYIINILIVVLLFTAVSIQKDGYFWGHNVVETVEKITNNSDVKEVEVERMLDDGTMVINTSSIASDIIGFAGRTPLEIYVKSGVIERVEYLKNSESPDFWAMIVESGLSEQWNSLTLEEATTVKIDGVSGATYSAEAVIRNVRRAAEYGAGVEASAATPFSVDWRDIAGVMVLLLGVYLTLVRSNRKWLITLQLILNVVVLGFWCGSFLSLTTFVSWASNGVNLAMSLTTILMAVVTLIMPLFNRRGSYCHIHCPMGSAQELLGKIPAKRVKISPNIAKYLNRLRYYILSVLLLVMWCGVGFDLMNYEVFSIFIWGGASTFVLIMAAIFLALSIFIPRPYCRFICPTGAIITMSQMKIDNPTL